MATKQKRLVVRNDDLTALQKIAEITNCGSASVALSLLVSRYGETFVNDWKASSVSNIVPVSHQLLPPSPSSNLTEPLDF